MAQITASEALILSLNNIAESNNRLASEINYLRQDLRCVKDASEAIKNIVSKIDLLKSLSGVLKG